MGIEKVGGDKWREVGVKGWWDWELWVGKRFYSLLILNRMENNMKKRCMGRGDLESACLDVLEKFCRKRYGTTIRKAGRYVRPVFCYCMTRVGMEARRCYTRTRMSKATFYRDVQAGEMMSMRTVQGKRNYNEIMEVMKKTIRFRRGSQIVTD